jgi:hypothetical protein
LTPFQEEKEFLAITRAATAATTRTTNKQPQRDTTSQIF